MALTEPSVVDEEGWSGANEGSPSATARPKLPRSNRAVVFWVASGLAAVGCILATASLGPAVLPRPGRHTAKTKDAVSWAAGTLEVVLPEDPDKECQLITGWAPWVSIFKCPEVIVPCSMEGDDCTRSQCCKEPGKQCYKKTDYYASCRADCEAGVHEEDDDGEPWSCETRGERAEGTPDDVTGGPTSASAAGDAIGDCADPGEDCSKVGCCTEVGHNCYKKNDGWASCKPECTAGQPDPNDVDATPWDCTEVPARRL